MLAFGSTEASLRLQWKFGLLEILVPVQAAYFVSQGFKRRDERSNMLLVTYSPPPCMFDIACLQALEILHQVAMEDVSDVEAYWIVWMLAHHLFENQTSVRQMEEMVYFMDQRLIYVFLMH